MERAPRCARFQPSGVPQKRGRKSCACSLCLPRQSGPGSQGLGGRAIPRCGAPTPFRGPSLSFRWRQAGARAFRPPRPQPQSPPRAGRVPAPCVSPRPSPPPCLLPPAGLGRSAACELFSGLSPSLCSANGRQCVPAGQFSLSPLVSHSSSWHLTEAPPDCPQGTQARTLAQARPPKTPFPGRVSVLSSFVSLFIFYILSYLLSKTMVCFSGRLMTSASDQKLFCEVCSAFRYSFDEFVGEKVVSPSYSSAILAPPSP